MPKIVDHATYRAELLDGAFALAARHGYGGLRMRDVAEALGVSTGTLYHYFDNKRDMYAQLVDHLTDQLVAEITDAIASAPTPRARLAALLDDVAAYETWYAQYDRLCLDALPEREAEDPGLMASTMDRTVAVLAPTLEIDAASARFVFVFTLGLVVERDLDGGATPFWEQAELLLEWFDALPPARRTPPASRASVG